MKVPAVVTAAVLIVSGLVVSIAAPSPAIAGGLSSMCSTGESGPFVPPAAGVASGTSVPARGYAVAGSPTKTDSAATGAKYQLDTAAAAGGTVTITRLSDNHVWNFPAGFVENGFSPSQDQWVSVTSVGGPLGAVSTYRVYDLTSATPTTPVISYTSSAGFHDATIGWSPDSRQFFVHGYANGSQISIQLRVYATSTGALIYSATYDQAVLNENMGALAFGSGDTFAYVSRTLLGATLTLVDLTGTQRVIRTLPATSSTNWEFSPDGRFIVVTDFMQGGSPATMGIYRVSDGHQVYSTLLTSLLPANVGAGDDPLTHSPGWGFSPDGDRFTYATTSVLGGTLNLVDLTKDQHVTDAVVITASSSWSFSPAGKTLAVVQELPAAGIDIGLYDATVDLALLATLPYAVVPTTVTVSSDAAGVSVHLVTPLGPVDLPLITYTNCVAGNPVAASAPTISDATAEPGAATVSWMAPTRPGTSPISGYRITATDEGDLSQTTTAVGVTTSAEVTGLEVGHDYSFTVAARNGSGYGAESAESAVVSIDTAAPIVVPTAPRTLTATAKVTAVGLTWKASSSNGGAAITSYRVYRSTDGKTFARIAVVTGRSYTATGLTGGKAYWFRVVAVNTVGASPASAIVKSTAKR